MPRDRIIYLPGLLGHPELSPALASMAAAGHEVIVPDLPGFAGRAGFVAPDNHLGWLTATWDAVDTALGDDRSPCHVVGASVGGMLAAELAIFRPELVKTLTLIAPFGIADADRLGFDLYATPAVERMAHVFAKGAPDAFINQYADRGVEEAPVAAYIMQIAMASLTWPLGDRGLAGRIHRIGAPTLVLWGDLDEILPVSLAARWSRDALVLTGAGHLAEWDVPTAVQAALAGFVAAHES
jgi:pimeloyl-ACP methyl ester carboxylesterase